jgi:hypothetical protein
MNYIVFTQDIPLERDWLNNKIPNCQNFETMFSGHWPSEIPTETSVDTIWEVPAEFKDNVESWPGKKIKSLFDLNHDQIDDRWCDSDDIIFDNCFTSGPVSKKALVLHLPRSGTKFLESILTNHCHYDRIIDRGPPSLMNYSMGNVWAIRTHHIPHNPNVVGDNGENYGKIDYDIIQDHQPDIFFVYRKNWWDWLTSMVILQHTGAFHYNTVPDLTLVPSILITEDSITKLQNMIKYAFNNLCQMRHKFKDLNFYIFEFSELIKNQTLTKHSKINYDKKSLIANYDEAKQLFDSKYLKNIELYEKRCVAHLTKMGAKMPTNFDNIGWQSSDS